MKKELLSLLLMLTLFVITVAVQAADSSSADRTPKIVLTGTDLTYNGQALKFGVPLQEWINIIGMKPVEDNSNREGYSDYRIYKWNDLGFFVIVNLKDDDAVESIQIKINEYNYENRTYWKTLKNFQGNLNLNHFQVTANTTPASINRSYGKEKGFLKFECRDTCFAHSPAVNDLFYAKKPLILEAGVDIDNYSSVLYYIQIGYSRFKPF